MVRHVLVFAVREAIITVVVVVLHYRGYNHLQMFIKSDSYLFDKMRDPRFVVLCERLIFS